jgi:hypothetical protein
MAWKYLFKKFVFLVQNEFISQEHYRSMFQEDKIVDEAFYFAFRMYPEEMSDDFTHVTHDLHELTETYTEKDRTFFSGNSVFFASTLISKLLSIKLKKW